MAEKVLIVKYGEIAMRGNNKYIFINRLISAIRKNLRPLTATIMLCVTPVA